MIAFVPGEKPWLHNLLLDIDYIFKWVEGPPPKRQLSFWISPCSLLFPAVVSVEGTLALESADFLPRIDALLRRGDRAILNSEIGDYDWLLLGHNFRLKIKSPGFRQVVRAAPVSASRQELDVRHRGAASVKDLEP